MLQLVSKPLTSAEMLKALHLPYRDMNPVPVGLQTAFPEKAFCAHRDFAQTCPPHFFLQSHFTLPPPHLPPLPPRFSSGIQTLPHNAKVHYNYANFLKDSGRHQEAIHHYTTALRSDSELKLSDWTHSKSHLTWVTLFLLLNNCYIHVSVQFYTSQSLTSAFKP